MKLRRLVLPAAALFFLLPELAAGAGSNEMFTQHTLLLVIMITLAFWCGFLFERMGLPELVGEITAGIVLGNLALVGIDFEVMSLLRDSQFMQYAAELGVVLLLFLVGLESNIRELGRVGHNAFMVAMAGVLMPVFLGLGAAMALGFATGLAAWFIGATLTATSVGITAKTLNEFGVLRTSSSQVILGAAVIDDVLGILLLAVLAGVATTGDISVSGLLTILLKAIVFFAVAMLVGIRVLPTLIRVTSMNKHSSFWTGFALCTALTGAYVASLAGLAPIIGAFVAGLLLDETHFKVGDTFQLQTVESLIKPITDIMLAIFFVSIGVQVQLKTLLDPSSLLIVMALLLVAVLSKGLAGFVVTGKGFDRAGIGAGMIPRGEVGLIFASFALSHLVFDTEMYSIIIMVVLLSTIMGPILLKTRMRHFAEETPEGPAA